MLERTLNDELRPLLARVGASQKLSDSTPGIPDWVVSLGAEQHHLFLESKIIKGSRIIHIDWRPGQLPFANRWNGPVLSISCHPISGLYFLHDMREHGKLLEAGGSISDFRDWSLTSSTRLELVIVRRLPEIVAGYYENAC